MGIEVRQIGNVTPNKWGDQANQGRVYDSDGLCPTLNSMQGGGRQPHIMEVIHLGHIEKGTGKHQSNEVISPDGLSPTVCASIGDKYSINHIECICIGGMQKHQAIKTDGICTTLTSSMGQGGGYVPMIVKSEMIVAMRGRGTDNTQQLEPNYTGTTNTITTVHKDNLVLETQVIAIDEQNKAIREDTFGTLTTDGSSPKHNNRVAIIQRCEDGAIN